jgi:hypothetical protein
MLIYIRRPCILRSIQNHTFTSLSLPQFLASIIIFTDWGKQGVTIPSPLKEHRPRCSIYHHDMYVQR